MSHHSEVRIILIGKTGVGKSAVGNTILNRIAFTAGCGSSSLTRHCQKDSAVIVNRTVTVVDSPDFFHSTLEEDLLSEIDRSVELALPGVHAFLYVIKPSTFTKQEAETVSQFKQTYGEDVFKHTIVVFTHGDKLQHVDMSRLIPQNESLMNLVTLCGGRFTVLNNEAPADRDQVYYLLDVIDRMVSANENSLYTIKMRRNHENKVKCSLIPLRYIYITAVFSLIMGRVFSTGSADKWTFAQGCGVGGLAAALGVITGKIWVLIWRNQFTVICLPTQQHPNVFYQCLKNVFGVFCGSLIGSGVSFIGSDQRPVILLGALAGAAGAYTAMHRVC